MHANVKTDRRAVENPKFTEVKATPIRAHPNSKRQSPYIRLVNGLML